MRYPDIPWETRWALIKRAVEAHGTSLTELGNQAGVSGIATAKRKRYPAGQAAIAELLGVSPACLFPERYGITWSDHYQAEVEKALPGLRGPAATERTRDLALRNDTSQQAPVELSDLPADPKERHIWLLEHLKARGYNLTAIAEHLGVKRSALYNLERVSYFQIQAFLAACLGVEPQAIWPERYTEEGEPLVAGNSMLLAPGQQAPHKLDLTDGLWLPIDALVGLPGMPATLQGLQSSIRVRQLPARARMGVVELPFSSLPAETQFFLTGASGGPAPADPEPVMMRKRRRDASRTVELRSDDLGYGYALQVDVMAKDARLTAICIDQAAQKFVNFQGVDMTDEELREVATALLEAAQMLEVSSGEGR